MTDARILSHLKRGAITPAVAYARYRCLALHSAIARLRKAGHRIVCTMKRRGTRHWGEYKMERR
jgi:hypothetical protein